MDCLHAAAKATEAAASKATKAATAAPGRIAPTPTASSNVKTAPSWRGIVTFTHPRTGGAHDSHHRTAGIARRARRRGRLAARGARAAAGACRRGAGVATIATCPEVYVSLAEGAVVGCIPGQVRSARTAAGLTDRRARPQQEGVSNEDASCCRHSCDGDRSPRSGEGEAGAIGAPPARLSVVGATRLLPRLPSE